MRPTTQKSPVYYVMQQHVKHRPVPLASASCRPGEMNRCTVITSSKASGKSNEDLLKIHTD